MQRSATGSYRLAEQIGDWAVYADVTISLVRRAAGQPVVECSAELEVDRCSWQLDAMAFGAVYALGSDRQLENLGVLVHRLDINPVDTTPIALAFATCHAVFKCLGVTPVPAPYFDRDSKSFVFPRA